MTDVAARRESVARAIHNELGESCDHRQELVRRWQCRMLADAALDAITGAPDAEPGLHRDGLRCAGPTCGNVEHYPTPWPDAQPGLDALPDDACGAMGLCERRKGHEGKHTTSVDRALEGVVLRAAPPSSVDGEGLRTALERLDDVARDLLDDLVGWSAGYGREARIRAVQEALGASAAALAAEAPQPGQRWAAIDDGTDPEGRALAEKYVVSIEPQPGDSPDREGLDWSGVLESNLIVGPEVRERVAAFERESQDGWPPEARVAGSDRLFLVMQIDHIAQALSHHAAPSGSREAGLDVAE